ncbi:hypothetical protein FNV43_RR22638 [Rhamnella rubrinervis]|uniref:BHLH domain-containing protein n=1 Tax=Rhamnella rubrinervis TaxID=2594499 RepID=A0A8K0GRA8_9ROSA|nr:hypothetical protein FNV43_RR22638 [Rhamnella rubrinervis]
MESMGIQGEWTSLSGLYTAEEADFMAQLLGNFSVPNEVNGASSTGVPLTSWPGHELTANVVGNDEGSHYSLEIANSNLYSFSQGSNSYSGGSSIFFPTSSNENCCLSDPHSMFLTNNCSTSIDFFMGDVQNTNSCLVKGDDCLNLGMSNGNVEDCGAEKPEAVILEQDLQLGKHYDMKVSEPAIIEKVTPSSKSMKRSRSAQNIQTDKRKVKLKKSQKLASTSNFEEESNTGPNGQSSSSCCSGDDSNASQELSGAVASSGKTRARRGSATDPQSLYARKRRERINERLRILQNLVPNGTKVDISTMLEEAVQYVKFLQLQIKLLSSDDMWMYAPIAYNGMDIGLDLNLRLAKQS